MNYQEKILGVVLCGGESKRMGSDKGLLLHGDKPWAELVSQKLKALNIPVAVSINAGQQEAYGKIFSLQDLIVDALPMHGPLNGLLTVHKQFPSKDVLLMACDIIDMQAGVLQQLIDSYEKHEDADFFAFEEDNFFQPLCAIYKAKALDEIYQQLTDGSLANYSFQYILNSRNTHRLKSFPKEAFTNYNTLNP